MVARLVLVLVLVLVLLATGVLVIGDTVPMVFTLNAETNNNEDADNDEDDNGRIPTSRCSINAELNIRSLVDDDMVTKNNNRIEEMQIPIQSLLLLLLCS